MLLNQNTALHLRYPGFRSFKTTQAIHYRHRYCRIALVLDTLDERVSELAPADIPLHGDDVGQDCIYRRKVGAHWETICIGRPTGEDDAMRYDSVLTREQTTTLPGYDNARMIWEKRNTRVKLPTRMVALEVMENQSSSTLGELLRRILAVGGTSDELLSLIANGTLQIDLCREMSSLTTVRKRGPGHEDMAPAGTRCSLAQTALPSDFTKVPKANYTRNMER